jgi:hypothetical protein
MSIHQRVGLNINRVRAALERLNGRCDVLGAADFRFHDLKPKRSRSLLNLTHLRGRDRVADVAQGRQPRQVGDDFAQNFDPLATKIGSQLRQAGDVAAWPRKAGDKAAGDRVIRYREDDRDDRRCVLQNWNRGSRCDDDIDLQPNKFRGDFRETLATPIGPAKFNRDGTPLDPTKLMQPLHKSGRPSAHG